MIIEKQRCLWIDTAKGIGIILVVYGHVLRGLHSSSIPLNKGFFEISDAFVYSFHMPLFFVLSGLFFKKSLDKYTPKGLFIEKIKTIFYPFLIWSIVQTGIKIVLSQYTNEQIGLDSLITCIFIPESQFWFLYALFFINIINIFFHEIFKKKWLIISLITGFLYYEYPINLSVFSDTFKYLIFFNLGIFLSDTLFEGGLLSKYSKLQYFMLAFLLFTGIEYFYIMQSLNVLDNFLLPAISGITIIILMSYIISKKTFFEIFNQLGKYSMEIYILHRLVFSGTRIILFRFLSIENIFIHITLGTLLGVIIPFVITWKLRNVTSYNRLFRLN
ncbi:MAG: acyltransferase family protein [Prevotella sp.]|nr:acyltransferase family protein [Prevotella sp.]